MIYFLIECETLGHQLSAFFAAAVREGGEDGVADTADLEGMMTTAEEVDDFTDTGIDFLAPAFGNVHGEYGGEENIKLDYDR